MVGKFKIIFLLLIFNSLFIFCQEQQKKIGIYFKNYPQQVDEKVLYVIYLIHKVEAAFDEKKTELNHVIKDIGQMSLKEVSNFSFANGYNGFYYIELFEKEEKNYVKIQLFDPLGIKIFDDDFYLQSDIIEDEEREKVLIEEWLNLFIATENLIKESNVKINLDYLKKKRKINLKHNFPYFSFAVSAISVKILFENQSSEFSIFPIHLHLAFFPLKYFEAGFLVQFDFNNVFFKYYDVEKGQSAYFQPSFTFYYGIFCGLSFFYEKIHFSIGVSFYNMIYLIKESDQWQKTDDIASYFLPQFNVYHRINFQLFKVLYYTVYFNVRTSPAFTLWGNQLGARPFNYEFVIFEVSLLGFSIIL